uniref:Uncharacterized protein n=1 Tax=Ananas comosus var. bracteatus TaxID=296719 RepID=A0A6V7QMB3_ANACO|nr:unnamed protein product [Ananas comosus var. bracteatus]
MGLLAILLSSLLISHHPTPSREKKKKKKKEEEKRRRACSLVVDQSSTLEDLKLVWGYLGRLVLGFYPLILGLLSFGALEEISSLEGILRLVDNSVRRIEGARDGSVGLT